MQAAPPVVCDPAAITIYLAGEEATLGLLILSQAVLSLQLPFAVFPLVMFTGDPHKMGPFVNSLWVKVLAWSVAVIIGALNVYLLYQTIIGI